jgi:hypothetical protein
MLIMGEAKALRQKARGQGQVWGRENLHVPVFLSLGHCEATSGFALAPEERHNQPSQLGQQQLRCCAMHALAVGMPQPGANNSLHTDS